MDQAGGDAEQLVAQSGGVRTSVLIDPGECLEQDREVPGHERSPHPHGVDGVVCGGELAQRGAEFGLADAVLDVGTATEPGLDIEDRLGGAGLVGGGGGAELRRRSWCSTCSATTCQP